jgi:hypothetical protein
MNRIVLQAGDVILVGGEAETKPLAPPTQQAALDLQPRKPGPNFDHIPEIETAKFSTQFSARDDARMVWICDNLPGRNSKQKIVKRALKEYLDRTIAEHTKL